jgi:hypothetical protein
MGRSVPGRIVPLRVDSWRSTHDEVSIGVHSARSSNVVDPGEVPLRVASWRATHDEVSIGVHSVRLSKVHAAASAKMHRLGSPNSTTQPDLPCFPAVYHFANDSRYRLRI